MINNPFDAFYLGQHGAKKNARIGERIYGLDTHEWPPLLAKGMHVCNSPRNLDAKFLHLCDLARMSTAALTFNDSVCNQMTNY